MKVVMMKVMGGADERRAFVEEWRRSPGQSTCSRRETLSQARVESVDEEVKVVRLMRILRRTERSEGEMRVGAAMLLLPPEAPTESVTNTGMTLSFLGLCRLFDELPMHFHNFRQC
jgi:hypothetical protein